MPCAASSLPSEKIALVAPRILKEPVFCRFSHLKKSRTPVSASRVAEVRTGVRLMRGAIRAWASVMARQSGCWGAGGSICGAALVAFTVLANSGPLSHSEKVVRGRNSREGKRAIRLRFCGI